jgi:16S rRNA (adenine1518-N6/adenine1519-N6)-dimethyltransferase
MRVPDGFHPSRKLGQNFLLDRTIIEKIVKVSAVQPGERLLEIGAGFGAMTRAFAQLSEAPSITAVEIDRRLCEVLRQEFEAHRHVDIRRGNVLSMGLDDLFESQERTAVVSNAPYSISGALMRWLMAAAPRIDRAIVMLQKEVTDRLGAGRGCKAYSVLTLLTTYYFRVERLFTVHPRAFWPRPNVDSVVIRLTPHKTPPVDVMNEEIFVQLIKAGFSLRRKTLRNSLGSMAPPFSELLSDIDDALAEAKIDPGLRGEALSIEDYARLANALSARAKW